MADGTSPLAPYLRVAATFRARIADGTWPPGHRMPSRPELGQEFAVGDNVIRRAQELLIAEGLLEGRPGAGTFVRAPAERRTLLRTPSPATDPPRPGLAPAGFDGTWEADSTAKVPAPPDIAARLAVDPGALCVRTVYELLLDRQPVLLSTSWEPMDLTGGTVIVLPEGGPLAGHGILARMAHIGITVARMVEVPRPVQIDRDQAQQLAVAAGSQATLIERTHYATDGRPVETADIVVPAGLWDITYDIPLPAAGS
ncbi:GntR family transcriptional regulator [Streptomyces sp. RKAG293]|uniref:GntR family transcriptional regulator n=1 Tax=Streptomyces sp. RKAG293 TaxID=2893403 RepID=UPI0020335DC8|nr:GntR family transcriptional regulator [Streptomyces sp. RKAG293]MCM2424227.1 GntR family transcriptional regulator [Streptomyces sp. RKAG293]